MGAHGYAAPCMKLTVWASDAACVGRCGDRVVSRAPRMLGTCPATLAAA